MKIAITGKGGVGKSTIAGLLCHFLAQHNHRVLAIDADPDANLARSLGIKEEVYQKIIPISKQRQLIEERTGAKVREYGQMFTLNPKVNDIADTYGYIHQGISFLMMGGTDKGAAGCACPENVLLRSLIQNLLLFRDEAVVLDMEAGIEHLGRGTTKGIDAFIVVVGPSKNSFLTAKSIMKLAKDLGIETFYIIGNNVFDQNDENLIKDYFSDQQLIGMIPHSSSVKKADFDNQCLYQVAEDLEFKNAFNQTFSSLISVLQS